jgi:hypothetical protein
MSLSFTDYLTSLFQLHILYSVGRKTVLQYVGKDLEGDGRGLFEVVYWLSGKTDED